MDCSGRARNSVVKKQHAGFSMLELMASLAILLVVSGLVMSGLVQMTRTQGTITNRTEMHSSVRNATELLQQEIGQAGRVALPGPVTLTGAVVTTGVSVTVGVSSAAGMFNGEQLVIDTAANQETVTATTVDPVGNTVTALFQFAHLAAVPVTVLGAFASGIVPTTATNGSTGSVLKMYGDINGDGNMVYVEYTCDTTGGYLYRNVMPFNAAAKPAKTSSMILLNNVQPNPNGTACFTFQQKTVGADTYVVDVAVTMSVQTQSKDPTSQLFQKETKALLNVSPRNVFDGWELAGIGAANRIQPMPPSVANLLP